MKYQEMMEALDTIERDRGISKYVLLEALANALVTAYKRQPDAAEEARVEIDVETGDISVIAQELDEDGNVAREWDDTPKDFGRIAAQQAKHVMLGAIRDAERDKNFEEYSGREGDIVNGIVQQTDSRYTLIELGRATALLPQSEQVPFERYEHGGRVKAYILAPDGLKVGHLPDNTGNFLQTSPLTAMTAAMTRNNLIAVAVLFRADGSGGHYAVFLDRSHQIVHRLIVLHLKGVIPQGKEWMKL